MKNLIYLLFALVLIYIIILGIKSLETNSIISIHNEKINFSEANLGKSTTVNINYSNNKDNESEKPIELIPINNSIDFFKNVRYFAYQLQNINLDRIRNSSYDLVVIDYAPDNKYVGFSKDQINYAKNGNKLIFSYLSIGEAENYRWYWKDEWDKNSDGVPDKNAPEWLLGSNPNWPGNYMVRYWHEEWQNIMLQYLDMIIDADFDGVVLDTVDSCCYFNDSEAKEEMKKFIEKIRKHSKNKNINFKIVVNGGLEFINDSDYANAIDGVLKESVYYFNEKPRKIEETMYFISILRQYKEIGKKVFIIEYIDESDKKEYVLDMVNKEDFLVFFSNKELNAS